MTHTLRMSARPRMARNFLAGIAASGLALLATPTVEAQTLKAIRVTDFAVSAGVAFPQGDAADVFNTGFNISGAVNYRPVNSLVGYRVEGQYARFGSDMMPWVAPSGPISLAAADVAGVLFEARGRLSVLAVTGNVVVGIPTASSVQPYLIGGAGTYHTMTRIRGYPGGCPPCGESRLVLSETQTGLGLNGGAGLEFRTGAFRTYVEGRFHSVFTSGANTNFIPISVGIWF